MAKFNIKDISPISHAAQCFIPCLFVAGEDDNFILPSHSEAIHKAYAGDKNIIIVNGDHNSPRPQFMFDSACIFLKACLQLTPENTTPVEIEEVSQRVQIVATLLVFLDKQTRMRIHIVASLPI